jgi:hypothetical protein
LLYAGQKNSQHLVRNGIEFKLKKRKLEGEMSLEDYLSRSHELIKNGEVIFTGSLQECILEKVRREGLSPEEIDQKLRNKKDQ